VVDSLFLENGDLVLIALSNVKPGDFSAISLRQKRAMAASTAAVTAGQEYQAYEELLLKSADVASNY